MKVGVIALVVVLAAAEAEAQVCHGHRSLVGSRARVGGRATISDQSSSFGGNVTFGRRAFGSVRGWWSDLDAWEPIVGFGGSGGYDFDVTPRFSVCPEIDVARWTTSTVIPGFEGIPLIDFPGFPEQRINFTGTGVGFSVSLGLAVPTRRATLLPFVSVGVDRDSYDYGGDVDFESSDTYGRVSLGLGLLFADRFNLRPSFSVPFARNSDSLDASFSVGFSVTF